MVSEAVTAGRELRSIGTGIEKVTELKVTLSGTRLLPIDTRYSCHEVRTVYVPVPFLDLPKGQSREGRRWEDQGSGLSVSTPVFKASL
jgi:hypothetical protein